CAGRPTWPRRRGAAPTDPEPTDPPAPRSGCRPTSPISFFACGATDGARAFGASGRLLLFLFRFCAFGSGRALALGRSERALMRPGRASNRVGFASTPIDTAPTLGLRRPLYPLTWCSGSGTRRRRHFSFSRIAVGADGDEA